LKETESKKKDVIFDSQMYKNMDLIMELPSSTHLFYGHEYAVANLEFAKFMDYDNLDVDNKLEECKIN
jgi:hypothetical protein